MKKSASPGTRKGPNNKKGPTRKAAAHHDGRALSAGTSTRLVIAPVSALAVIEPVARRGATELRRVRFGYFKPEAGDVHVVGSFNGWNPRATPLHRDAFGDWSVEIELPTGEHRYRFFVDGEWRDDPSAQQTAQNPFGGFDAVMVVV